VLDLDIEAVMNQKWRFALLGNDAVSLDDLALADGD
jgi:hypothetical protein